VLCALNLVVSKIIEEDFIVDNFCKMVKTIVSYFKRSVVADQLRLDTNLKLIQSIETR